MPRTEDGEFELVLGNKQMLSVFFIIVILLGVFFTMGYIFGRNSAPVAMASGQNSATPQAGHADAPSAMSSRPAADQQPSVESTPPPGAANDTGPTGAAAAANQPPAPAPAAKPAETVPSNPAMVVTPEPGQTFVQVSSMLERPAAEILVDVLRKKNFQALIAPGPNEKFRVLVGPVKDATDAGRIRSDLEQAGFKGAFVKRY